MGGILAATATAPDFGTLMAPVANQALATITDVMPLGILVVGGLVGIGLALRVLGKFGVKR